MFFFEDQKNARPYTIATPTSFEFSHKAKPTPSFKKQFLRTHRHYKGLYRKLRFMAFMRALIILAKGDHRISRKQQTIINGEKPQTTALPQKLSGIGKLGGEAYVLIIKYSAVFQLFKC